MIRYADIEAAPIPVHTSKPAKLEKARDSMAETENTRETKKRGRPAKPETEKPWIAAGLSRAAWYRRRAG